MDKQIPDVRVIDVKPKYYAQLCPVCHGFGTLKYGTKTCQGCDGKGCVVIPTEAEGI